MGIGDVGLSPTLSHRPAYDGDFEDEALVVVRENSRLEETQSEKGSQSQQRILAGTLSMII